MDGAPVNTQVNRIPPQQPSAGGGSPYIDASKGHIEGCARKIIDAKTPPHLRTSKRPLNTQEATAPATPFRTTIIQEGAREIAPAQVAAAISHNPNITGIDVLASMVIGPQTPPKVATIIQLAREAREENAVLNGAEAHAS